MRKTLLLVIVGSMICSGCVTTEFLADRKQDAADIFTATVGFGVGLKARAGLVHVGLIHQVDRAGLRGGEWGELDYSMDTETMIPLPLPSSDGHQPFMASAEDFEPRPDQAAERGKDFQARGTWPFATSELRTRKWSNDKFPKHPYYTQLEIAAGLGGAFRLGFNPGELVDFILGWVKIDIFNDDIATSENEE